MSLGYDGSIRIDTKINSRGFSQGISSMGSALKRLGGIVAAVFSVAAVVQFGKESVKAASELSSALIGLQSIVEGQGRSFSQAQGFIQSYIKDGLVPLQDAVTAYKNLAMRGYDTTQIETTLVALKDSAAFGRQASLTMGKAVASATEGLKNENSILVDNAGVTKNVSVMWKEYAQELGVGVQSLTKQQKIQAEVNGILRETRFQTGDAAKVANTYAGQVSMLSFNFQQLKVAVGNALIPIAQAVLPSINQLISSLTELASIAAQVTTLLFGGELNAQADAQDKIASSGNAAADATGNLADATTDAGDSAKQAAKDMKGMLAGFDELNQLAGSTSTKMEGVTDGLDIPTLDDEQNKAGGNQLFGNVELSPAVIDAVSRFKEQLDGLKEVLASVWDVFAQAWDLYGAGVIDAAKAALGSIIDLIKSIGLAFVEVWTNGTGEEVLKTLLTLIQGVLGFIEQLAQQIKQVFDEMGEALAQAFFNALNSILSLISAIGSAFSEAWNSGVGIEILETIMSILTNIFELIGTLADKMREAWESNGNGVAIWQSILNIVKLVLEFVDKLLAATITWAQGLSLEPIVVSFREMLEALEPLVAIILDGLAWAYENILLPLASWVIEDAAVAAIDLLTAAFKVLYEALEILQPAATWIWNDFLQPLAAWSGDIIIGAIHTLTDALNNLSSWMRDNKELIEIITIAIASFVAVWTVVNLPTLIIKAGSAIVSFAINSGLATMAVEALVSAVNVLRFALKLLVSGNTYMILIISAVITVIVLLIKNWDKVKEVAAAVWETIKSIWSVAADWFTEYVIEPIKNAFRGLINFLLGIVEGFVNFFVDGINGVISILNLLSIEVPEWVPIIGGETLGFDFPTLPPFKIPRLATGALIPPNSEFLAILGDQKSGTNIEAPLSAIEDVVGRALDTRGGASGPIDITVRIVADSKFTRALKVDLDEQSRLGGVKLVRGGAY